MTKFELTWLFDFFLNALWPCHSFSADVKAIICHWFFGPGNRVYYDDRQRWKQRIWHCHPACYLLFPCLNSKYLDLDNVTFENFKSVLYGYYSRALAINYDPDSPRSFKSICLKWNTARFLDQEISCCMWFSLLLLYLKLTLPNMDLSHGDILQPRNGMNYQMTLE